MKSKFIFFLIICFFQINYYATAQQKRIIDKNSPGSDSLIMNYFKAYNSGNPEEMVSYLSKYMTEKTFSKISVEERKNNYKNIFENIGKVEIVSVDMLNNKTIVLVQDKNSGEFQFIFNNDTEVPDKIGSLFIERGDNDNSQNNQTQNKANDEEAIASIKEYFSKMAGEDKFSGSILIAKKGEVIFENAYGFADREKKIPNKVDTRFNVGSIIKGFTQDAITLLASQNKISLDDNVIKYLPDYPNKEAAKKITIRQLLNHTSGLGDFFNDNYEKADKLKIKSTSDYLQLFINEPLLFEPGKGNRYSNAGYALLGAIIEKITGQNYYDFIQKNIFNPAGMNNTGFFEKDKLPSNTALGYLKDLSKESKVESLIPNFDTLPGKGSSAGGGYSNVYDLLKYLKALSNGVIKSNNQNGGVARAGGAPGVNSVFEWGRDYIVVVMTNLDPPSAGDASKQIMQRLPGR